jgi:hypothetical protein
MLTCRSLPRPTRSTAVREHCSRTNGEQALAVIDTASGYAAKDAERVASRLSNSNLMRLQRIGTQQKGPAV